MNSEKQLVVREQKALKAMIVSFAFSPELDRKDT
jgi:hypothetical protein